MTVLDVLVIGEALMDIVDDGSSRVEHPGGSPANVALGLGRRGTDVALLTDLGRDERGARIVGHLERSGVRVLEESFSDRATCTATAVLGADGSAEYDFDVQWRLSSSPVPVSAAVVHTGSIAAFLAPGRAAVLAHLGRLAPAIVTFDPNIRPSLLGTHAETLTSFWELAALADLVKMSDDDAAWLFPTLTPEEIAITVGALGPRLVVVTQGDRGAILRTATSDIRVPAVATAVADTIGAGDTYMASLIADTLSAADGFPGDAAVALMGARAARAAAITVSRAGADLPWQHELVELPRREDDI